MLHLNKKQRFVVTGWRNKTTLPQKALVQTLQHCGIVAVTLFPSRVCNKKLFTALIRIKYYIASQHLLITVVIIQQKALTYLLIYPGGDFLLFFSLAVHYKSATVSARLNLKILQQQHAPIQCYTTVFCICGVFFQHFVMLIFPNCSQGLYILRQIAAGKS